VDDLLRLLPSNPIVTRPSSSAKTWAPCPTGCAKLIARSILGMRVLLFEQDNGQFKPILDWPDNALATTSTHDLPTLNGWWHGRDIDWNARLGLIDAHPGAME
jgi:4-alpha-glucanotransferase